MKPSPSPSPLSPESGISSLELVPLLRFTTAQTPAAPDTQRQRECERCFGQEKEQTHDELDSHWPSQLATPHPSSTAHPLCTPAPQPTGSAEHLAGIRG